MILFREELGEVLRRTRQAQGLTLRALSKESQVSLGYLSEVERGEKEASSEVLSSVCRALGIPLSEVLSLVSVNLATAEAASRPVDLMTRRAAPLASAA